MEAIKKSELLEYPPDVIQAVRKIHGLDKPGAMSESIDILEEWLKKQDHILRKDILNRKRLEWFIITSKGSVERAKSRIDKFCTIKTMLNFFYERRDLNDMTPTDLVPMPKMQKDYYRIMVFKNNHIQPGKTYSYISFFMYVLHMIEFIKEHDYMNGYEVIVDYRDCDILQYVKLINIVELRQASALLDGYSLRIKAIHIISNSSTMSIILSVLKQALSPKLGQRLIVHKSIETVYDYFPREYLSSDLGGKERSCAELHREWRKELGLDEHINHIMEMAELRVVDSRREQDGYLPEYLGIEGTFRNLVVD